MRATSSFLFRDESMWFSRLVIKSLVCMHEVVYNAYPCDLMLMCVEFRDEILLMGEECKTRENSNFLKNGKMVISIENPEFF